MSTVEAAVAVLEARGLIKRYGSVTALDGADFDLRPREILAVSHAMEFETLCAYVLGSRKSYVWRAANQSRHVDCYPGRVRINRHSHISAHRVTNIGTVVNIDRFFFSATEGNLSGGGVRPGTRSRHW